MELLKVPLSRQMCCSSEISELKHWLPAEQTPMQSRTQLHHAGSSMDQSMHNGRLMQHAAILVAAKVKGVSMPTKIQWGVASSSHPR